MKSFNSKTSDNNGASAQKQPDDFFQAKLNVGQPGDKYELEADQMAEQVVGEMNGGSPVSKADHQVQSQQEEDVQTKETSETEGKQKPLAETITPVVQAKVEEEQVQEKEEEEELQKKEDEEVQMNSVAGSDEEDESNSGSLQAKSDQESSVSPQLESQIKSGTGGAEMDKSTRSSMESGFGADFSDVKVHTDSSAVQMSQELGAQAFTHGNDIYFNEGKYDPGSSAGQHLLAHELTHTIQQGSSGAIQGKMVQKVGEKISDIEFTLNDGTRVYREPHNKQLEIPGISLPDFKERNRRRFPNVLALRRGTRVDEGHREIWKESVRESVTRHVDNKLPTAERTGGFEQNSETYFFKAKNSRSNFYLFGTREEIIDLTLIPIWDKSGFAHSYDVDHVVEDQLVNSQDPSLTGLTTSNRASNFELLDSSANSSSGPRIAGEITRKLNNTVTQFSNEFPNERELTMSGLRHGYNVNFLSHTFDLGGSSGEPNNYWDHREIVQGVPLNKLEPLSGRELRLMNREDRPVIFTSAQGGNRTFVNHNDLPINNWLPRVNLTEIELAENPSESNPAGWITVDAYKAEEASNNAITGSYDNIRWRLASVPGIYGAAIDKEYFRQEFGNTAGRSLRLPGLSPIQINRSDITDRGIYVEGKVLPTVPFVANADIDIIIDGDNIRLRKLFTSNEFSMPSPFSISNTSLEVSFGTSGLGIEGQVNFGIDQVGEGHIGASASTGGGFELEGAFNFDSELFDPAEINVEYKDNIWTIGGEIGIPEGKVRGVKSATINAAYSENNFSATGEAELDIPGIERGSMSIQYGEEGFSIGGNFDLSSDIPGITGGNVEARVSKAPGDEEYSVFVSGTAQPDIPGISSSLSVTYENGVITLEGRASYERGMLSGTIEVGATNRAIGEDGEPTGEPDENFSVYGGGTLTLQLTPWLAATAGVKFTPEGEIEVTARLDADSYEVFSRREFNRNLFTVPTIEIPLFAIPLGPRSIGLVAQIGGGLDFSAGFGPGELRNMSAEITYNPEHEEETTVAGHGEFGIPADAGLTLRGDLSLGVSAGIASLTGGIELAGELGLEGEALASVDVNWSPQTGLAIDAEGRITVNPKFTFELNAFARASLGVGFLSVSETWRHNLASYEWGPDIQFGIVFPVEYREGEPFDMSFDDIEVIYPDLDVVNMAKGLARDVKNDLFD